MVKARTWFTLCIMSLGTVAATASCGSDEATGGPGAGAGSIITAGNAGAAGHAGSVSRAGSGGGPNGTVAALGSECESDADCGTGMVCLTPDSTALGDGGPSNGMCTLACTSTDDCAALEPGADCFNFGTKAAPELYCLEACFQGGTAADAATKCQGRPDFACVDLAVLLNSSTPAPFCLPQCIADADCGTGLYCDKGSRLGLCTKTKPVGDPVGAPCDPTATTPTCKGLCLRTSDTGVTPVTGSCAEYCSGGTGCMYSGNTPGGYCAGALSAQWGVGDIGFCEPICSCTSDCPFPGDMCRKWADDESAVSGPLGSDGLCFPFLDNSVELTCGEGGAGGDSAGGAGGDGTLPGAGGASGSN